MADSRDVSGNTTFCDLPLELLKRAKGFSYGVHGTARHVWAKRQTQNLPSNLLGNRQGPRTEPQVGVGTTEMRRDRIVDDGLDTRARKVLLQGVSFAMSNDEQVPDRVSPFGNKRQTVRSIFKVRYVRRGDVLASGIPLIKVTQLHPEERCL